MNRKTVRGIAVLPFVCLAATVSGSVEFGLPFADHMVLQREKPVAVWGWASPGETVRVSFADQEKTAVAGTNGEWRVALDPMKASAEGRVLTAAATGSSPSSVTVSDVLVGEVWFAGGQSNMNFPVTMPDPRHCDENGSTVAQYIHRPHVRFAKCHSRVSRTLTRRGVGKPDWKDIRWENVRTVFQADGTPRRGLSAVAYYYALELHDELRVPVGILTASVGGTNIEQWTPREGYDAVPELREYNTLYPVAPEKWTAANCRGAVTGANRQPASYWNATLEPLTPFTFRGVIWYQGEANAGDWRRYTILSHALYRGWAKKFGNPELPFFFVQVCPWGSPLVPDLQEAQARFAAEEPHAAIAIANDVGNIHDIHPRRKQIVAQRLALHAFKRVYGYADIQDNSPTVESWTIEGSRFRLKFRDAKKLFVYNEDRSLYAGFEVAGADGEWKPAEIGNFKVRKRKDGGETRDGFIDGPELIVSSKDVAAPVRLRFLHSKPWKGVLYSEVNLPVGAFQLPEVR